MSSGWSQRLVSRRNLLAGAALAAAAPRAFAATDKGDDVSEIVTRGTLRFAMPRFATRPFFTDTAGDESGLDVEMAHGLAAALQVAPTFDRSATTFDDAVARLAAGEADIAICKLSRTLKRGRTIRYSRPYAALHHGLITNRVRFAHLADGRPADDVVRDFHGEIGVIAHSSFAEFASTNFPNASIREFDDWSSMIDAVRDETLDMAYRDDFEIKKLLVDDPSLTVVARSITLTDKTDTLAIGIRPDASHLAAFADLYLDLARNGVSVKTDEIIARYRADKAA